MRMATGMISFALMVAIFLQSRAIYLANSAAGDLETASMGASGFFVAFLFLLGGAFAFKLPNIAGLILIGASLLAFLIAAGTPPYEDMYFGGAAALLLSFMSFYGSRRSRKAKERDHDPPIPPGDDRMPQ